MKVDTEQKMRISQKAVEHIVIHLTEPDLQVREILTTRATVQM